MAGEMGAVERFLLEDIGFGRLTKAEGGLDIPGVRKLLGRTILLQQLFFDKKSASHRNAYWMPNIYDDFSLMDRPETMDGSLIEGSSTMKAIAREGRGRLSGAFEYYFATRLKWTASESAEGLAKAFKNAFGCEGRSEPANGDWWLAGAGIEMRLERSRRSTANHLKLAVGFDARLEFVEGLNDAIDAFNSATQGIRRGRRDYAERSREENGVQTRIVSDLANDIGKSQRKIGKIHKYPPNIVAKR